MRKEVKLYNYKVIKTLYSSTTKKLILLLISELTLALYYTWTKNYGNERSTNIVMCKNNYLILKNHLITISCSIIEKVIANLIETIEQNSKYSWIMSSKILTSNTVCMFITVLFLTVSFKMTKITL